MKHHYPDLDAADRNWIQFSSPGNYKDHCGANAGLLMGSDDFECTKFPFQVWELSGYRPDGSPVAILRANQSTLEGALKYMQAERILVYNAEADLPF